MTILIAFLTVVLVLNCLLMILLVLMQLPKKEAGAGLAFGGAATDALFGAGSGNFLTKATKYSATIFLLLSLSLSIMNTARAKDPTRRIEEELRKKAASSQSVLPAPSAIPQIELPVNTNANAAGNVPAAGSTSTSAAPSLTTPPPATNAATPANQPAPAAPK